MALPMLRLLNARQFWYGWPYLFKDDKYLFFEPEWRLYFLMKVSGFLTFEMSNETTYLMIRIKSFSGSVLWKKKAYRDSLCIKIRFIIKIMAILYLKICIPDDTYYKSLVKISNITSLPNKLWLPVIDTTVTFLYFIKYNLSGYLPITALFNKTVLLPH